MEYTDKFKDKSYSQLTKEDYDNLSSFDLVNKVLTEDIDQLIKYHSKYVFMRKNLLASIVLTVVMLPFIGTLSLFGLIPVIFFYLMYRKRKMNVTWCMRILKMSISFLRYSDEEITEMDYIFENQLSRLDGIIDIGEHYKSAYDK